jgi:hydroxyacylglutathione hydrolase
MLGYLPNRIGEIPTGKPVVVHCRTQNRSAIGASILQAKGIPNVIKMRAGYQGWAVAGLPIERNGK